MGIDTANLRTLYDNALRAGHVLPAFPLAPLADYADRFFHDAIIDGWDAHKAELFQSAGSEFDMALTDDAGNIRDDAVKTYYQLVHANAALIVPAQRVPNSMIEWRTALLVFAEYGAPDELYAVSLPLLTIEDMLVQNRHDALWDLARNGALESVMRDSAPDKNKNDNKDKAPKQPLHHPAVERLEQAHAAAAVYEGVTGRILPARPQSVYDYGPTMNRALDDVAQFGRNGADCTRPIYMTDVAGDPDIARRVLMYGNFSLQ